MTNESSLLWQRCMMGRQKLDDVLSPLVPPAGLWRFTHARLLAASAARRLHHSATLDKYMLDNGYWMLEDGARVDDRLRIYLKN
ncbi:hypothetical protein PoB_001929600 [Plakobranchus ocellatus]|uniref:Uncharacterized protein n=1 Tax=Plakobranchus ocellatus TaxID=259542 RepID=A0AAV3ZA27_9GAST|nr:hypothetical protein PoB_001929600 [Plakobranchus ocellatus]